VSPNKLLDYMMAGKPVIHAIEAANDLVAEAQCGISIAPQYPRQIADAVLALMATPHDMRQRMGARGKAHIEQYHDYSILARRFIDFVDNGVRPDSRCGSSGIGRPDKIQLAA
jgi:glycosyltransferase involved in cell wall biosynthesis